MKKIRRFINEPHNLRSFTVIALFILAWISRSLDKFEFYQQIIFWVEVTDIGGLLLIANQKEKVETKNSQFELLNETRHLKTVTRNAAKSFSTLPKERVLIEMERMVQTTYFLTFSTFRDADKINDDNECDRLEKLRELYEDRIRQVLNQIVTFAEIFDENDSEEVDYHINVMLKIKTSELGGDELALLEEKCKFQGVGFALRHNESALMLVPGLSTNTLDKEPTPDNQSVVCFDIPDLDYNDKDNLKHLLPGAPRALFTDYEEYSDTEILVRNCLEKNGVDITSYKANQVREYFTSTEEGRCIKSFISIPIKTTFIEKYEDVVGVINIHRNKTHPTHEKYPAKSFSMLTKPLILNVYYLMLAYQSQVPKYWKKFLL